MRTISEAKKHWRQLDGFHSLTDLKIAVSSHNEPQITAGLRSVCWKIFLVFKTLDRSIWPARLQDSRAAYNSLRSHHLRAIQNPDEFESSVDPLSENEESPWVALRADEALRAEIFQDIERCMPDNVYFRQPATQNMMLDILFVFCKMHPNIGYRQGMHEVLAPILWVTERDAIDTSSTDRGEIDQAIIDMFDSNYIEHDTFTLFSLVMQTAKSFYAPAETGSTTKDTPMLLRSGRIYERYLPRVDPGLSAHLVRLEIVPQIFLLWIRLLFGREFPLDSVLDMWDALFAIDPTLELVDMVSIAMLLRIRWQLIESDTNEAFSLLLRYPEPDTPAYTFIRDALFLKDHLTPEGGAEIITRHGKKAPVIDKTAPEIRLPSPSPSQSSLSSRSRPSIPSPRSFLSQQSGGLEGMLQNAAKGVLDRGSQWGVGKAIREAVGEVKKNVEAYQSGTASGDNTPRSGGREYRKPERITPSTPGRPAPERTQSGNFVKRVESLERRNQALSKMLESAVGELWDYHKEQSESARENKDAVEALSLAIAKVQFVQVYLEDSSIPLPVEEVGEAIETISPESVASPLGPETTGSAPAASSRTHPRPRPTSTSTTAAEKPSHLSPNPRPKTPDVQVHSRTPSSSLSPRSRPMLSSSSFSWMLGQPGQESEPARSTFAKASEHSAFPSDERRRMRGSLGKGYLFGDEDDGGGPGKEGTGGGKRGSVSAKPGKKGKEAAEVEVEEEIIDLGDMRKKGAVS